jgi:hypothetical protein
LHPETIVSRHFDSNAFRVHSLRFIISSRSMSGRMVPSPPKAVAPMRRNIQPSRSAGIWCGGVGLIRPPLLISMVGHRRPAVHGPLVECSTPESHRHRALGSPGTEGGRHSRLHRQRQVWVTSDDTTVGHTFSATAHVWRTGNAHAGPHIPRPRTTTTEHTCVSGRFVVQPPIGQGRSMAINTWIPPDVFGILEHRRT